MPDFSCPDAELVMTVEEIQNNRSAWLDERRKGITASDVAALMGEGRYSSEFEVWLNKTGRDPDKEQTIQMEMGLRFEAAAAEKFSDDMGLEVRRRGMLRHKQHPLLLCNADRLVEDGYGLEIKVVNGFFRLPTDLSVRGGWPAHWYWQGIGNLLVTGRAGWYLAAAIGNSAFEIRSLDRSHPQVQADMQAVLEVVSPWWTKYVLGSEIPEMGGTDVPAMDTVAEGSKWSAPIPEMLADWRDRLRELRSTKKEIADEEKELKAKIDAEAGGVEWLLADGVPLLHFNPVKGRSSFKKAALFGEAPVSGHKMAQMLGEADWLDDEQSSRLIAWLLANKMTEPQFTTRGDPSRSLLIVGDDTKED